MDNRVAISFEDVANNDKALLRYLMKHSDSFSALVRIKKPYSQMPPQYVYSEIFHPYTIQYIYEKNNWIEKFSGKLKHQIMIECICDKELYKQMLVLPNIFNPVNSDFLEDICFYRNKKLWFATISHEKSAFLIDPSKSDVDYLMQIGITLKI